MSGNGKDGNGRMLSSNGGLSSVKLDLTDLIKFAGFILGLLSVALPTTECASKRLREEVQNQIKYALIEHVRHAHPDAATKHDLVRLKIEMLRGLRDLERKIDRLAASQQLSSSIANDRWDRIRSRLRLKGK